MDASAINYWVPITLLASGLMLAASLAWWARWRQRARQARLANRPPRMIVHSINHDRCTGCGSCVTACPTKALALVDHKSCLAHPDRCLQCERCAQACATHALVMHPMGEEPPPVTVPEIDELFQTRVPGQYLIGEIAGKPLVKHAANLGRAVVEHMVRAGLRPNERASAPSQHVRTVDVAIVGSGPGGLSAALTCKRYGLSCVVLEKDRRVASTIAGYPKGKPFMAEPSETGNYSFLPVFDCSKEELLDTWQRVLDATGVRVHTGEPVELVERSPDGIFSVRTTQQSYNAQRVVLAIGVRGKPRRLGIPGEGLENVRYGLEDADEHARQRVVVIGGGDTALEAACGLAAAGARVTLSYRGPSFRRANKKNRDQVEAAVARGSIEVLFKSNATAITEADVALTLGDGSERRVPASAVFVLIGAEPPLKWLAKMGVQFVKKPHSHQLGATDDLVESLCRQPVPCPNDASGAIALVRGKTAAAPRRVPPPIPVVGRAGRAPLSVVPPPIPPPLPARASRPPQPAIAARTVLTTTSQVRRMNMLRSALGTEEDTQPNVTLPMPAAAPAAAACPEPAPFSLAMGTEPGTREHLLPPPATRKRPSGEQSLAKSLAELRALPLFDGMSDVDLSRAIAHGKARRILLERDEIVIGAERARDTRGVYVLASGQLAAAVFEPETIAAREREQARRAAMTAEELAEEPLLPPQPLSRDAHANLMMFESGEVFELTALREALRVDHWSGNRACLAVYAVTRTTVVVIEPESLAEISRRVPAANERLWRALVRSRERLHALPQAQENVLDFSLRNGLSVAGARVRIRQMDLCIDCRQCEKACETRHGAARMSRRSVLLGALDFVRACRTCTDRRCLELCEPEAIRYDEQRGEVIIDQGSCTGCSLCAQLCPYGSIEMVELDDSDHPNYSPRLKRHLEDAGKLGFGPGTSRLAPVRRVANKCDHCFGHDDQACLRACPTGALIEVPADKLFRDGTAAPEIVGLRSDVTGSVTLAPTAGLSIAKATLRKPGVLGWLRSIRPASAIIWIIGLGAWLACLAEILLRTYAPAKSLDYYFMVHGEGLLPGMALRKVDFHPGDELAVYCGFIGAGLMLIALLYPFFHRMQMFRRVAKNRLWFDIHLMAGIVGPLFIVLHSALRLHNWVAISFWAMIIVVVSGFVGRYLYTKISRPWARGALRQWRSMHIVFCVLMVVSAGAHIWVAWIYSM